MTLLGHSFGLGTHPEAAACTGECQKSGPLGLLVILLLCVACYFLFKSMSKHLKRVREDFPEPAGSPAAAPAAEPAKVDLVKRADVIKRTGAVASPAAEPRPAPESTSESDST